MFGACFPLKAARKRGPTPAFPSVAKIVLESLGEDLVKGGYGARHGIVNLAARGMLVVSVAWRLGSEVLCSPIVLPRSSGAGPQKAPWVR
jgi:hypothetical protein